MNYLGCIQDGLLEKLKLSYEKTKRLIYFLHYRQTGKGKSLRIEEYPNEKPTVYPRVIKSTDEVSDVDLYRYFSIPDKIVSEDSKFEIQCSNFQLLMAASKLPRVIVEYEVLLKEDK